MCSRPTPATSARRECQLLFVRGVKKPPFASISSFYVCSESMALQTRYSTPALSCTPAVDAGKAKNAKKVASKKSISLGSVFVRIYIQSVSCFPVTECCGSHAKLHGNAQSFLQLCSYSVTHLGNLFPICCLILSCVSPSGPEMRRRFEIPVSVWRF